MSFSSLHHQHFGGTFAFGVVAVERRKERGKEDEDVASHQKSFCPFRISRARPRVCACVRVCVCVCVCVRERERERERERKFGATVAFGIGGKPSAALRVIAYNLHECDPRKGFFSIL